MNATVKFQVWAVWVNGDRKLIGQYWTTEDARRAGRLWENERWIARVEYVTVNW